MFEEVGYVELLGEDLPDTDKAVKETLLYKFLTANRYDVEKRRTI